MEGHLFKLETNTAAHLVKPYIWNPYHKQGLLNGFKSLPIKTLREVLLPNGSPFFSGQCCQGWYTTFRLIFDSYKFVNKNTEIINITQHKRSNNTIFYSYHIHSIVFNMWHSNCSSGKGQKRKKYIRASYARISQDIIKLFVHYVNCISNRKVWQTTAKNNYQYNKSKPFPCSCASGYNDFRTLPCESQFGHKWLPHIMDHFSKYSWLLANNKKWTKEVAQALTNLFWMFGFPSILAQTMERNFKARIWVNCAKSTRFGRSMVHPKHCQPKDW